MPKHDSAQSLADLLEKTQKENDITNDKLEEIRQSLNKSSRVDLPQAINSI